MDHNQANTSLNTIQSIYIISTGIVFNRIRM